MRRNRKSSPLARLGLTLAFLLPLLAMPVVAPAVRDGNGGFALPSNGFSVPITGGTLVASEALAVWADIEAEIANSVAADGQTTMSGDLKMGGQNVTGLAVGTANTDGVTLGQVQNSGMRWGGVAGGTANALTFALSPVITAYVDGQTFFFVSSANANTGATTVNINSVAVETILKNGVALVAGDIAASTVYAITFYNSNFHLWSPLPTLTATYAQLAAANTFTAAQSISLTAAGTAMNMASTDGSASSGPNILVLRDSPSPAASDGLGGVFLQGKDSGGNTTTYADFFGVILDPTDTSEDGRLLLRTITAGATATVLDLRAGVQVGAPTDGDMGAGTLNAAAGLYIAGHGTVAQFVESETATYTTAGTILPVDDTIPQNTEGDEILTVAITPVNASSTLIIEVGVQGAIASTSDVACAVFVDTTASAIAARGQSINTGQLETIGFTHTPDAGSTSARTYKLRCGSGAATDVKINGDGSTRLFGGVQISSLTVTEVLPQ